jgi:hypothetical protein
VTVALEKARLTSRCGVHRLLPNFYFLLLTSYL